MNRTFFMGFWDLFRKQEPLCKIFWNLACDQITLGRCNCCVFIRIFFHNIFVSVLDQTEDRIISCVCLTNQFTAVSIYNVSLGKNKLPLCHELLFNDILNIFNQHSFSVFCFDAVYDLFDFFFRNFFAVFNFGICLLNGNDNLAAIIGYGSSVSFDYLHFSILLLKWLSRYWVQYLLAPQHIASCAKKRQKNERFKICETKKSFWIFCNSMSPTVTHYSITILVCLYQMVQNIEKKIKKQY